jgi:hypothetical protein
MGLKNLVIPSDTVQIPGNDDLVVRGLGLDAAVFLVRDHQDVLSDMFAKAQNGGFDGASAEAFALEIAQIAPDLAAKIIACGAGEPEEWQAAKALPITVQVDAIFKVGKLTFAGEGGLEKLMETVLATLSGVAALQNKSA